MIWIEGPYLQFWGVTLLVFFALYGWVAALDYLLVNWLLSKKRGRDAGLELPWRGLRRRRPPHCWPGRPCSRLCRLRRDDAPH